MNTDIFDANGKIVVYGNEIPDIIIEEGTMMMKKYPTGGWFQMFKIKVNEFLKFKKTGKMY